MSKRGMDIQGGKDGPFQGGGTETPMDTPTKATAAQLARRKIATPKSRTARSTSPTKTSASFPGFSTPQPASGSQQSGFAFGQNGTSGGTSNNFGFDQSQSNTNSGFSFGGQPQSGASNSFTFGQSQPQQNSGFTFGMNSGTSSSFPPAGSNPFSSANGASTSNQSSGGFSGSIFNLPPAGGSPQSQPLSNGFGFGATSSSLQTTQNAGLSEADKQVIMGREPYLDSAQQKRLEEIVGSHLPDTTSAYQKDPLDAIPPSVGSQIVEYLRSLPQPSIGPRPNVESLFVKPYRNKSKLPWVSDSERDEIKNTAMHLSPENQQKITQVVKDNVESLSTTPDEDLPSVDRLPNDVQRRMLDFIRSAQGSGTSTPQKPQNAFGLSGQNSEQSSTSEEEKPKSNPFASIKTGPSASVKPTTGFSFGSQANTPAKTDGQTSSLAPTFSFGKSTSTPPSAPTEKPSDQPSAPAAAFSFTKSTSAQSRAPAESISQADEEASPKANPFANVARPSTTSGSPLNKEISAAPKSMFGSTTSSTSEKLASTSFNVQGSGENKISSPATPPASKPSFSFSQATAKTPAPASSNIFNFSAANPPATAPVQKTSPFSGFGGSQPASKPMFSAQQAPLSVPQTTEDKAGRAPESGATGPSAVADLEKFNLAFRKHLETLSSADDWSSTMKFYVQEAQKLRREATRSKQNTVASTQVAARPSSFPVPGQTPDRGSDKFTSSNTATASLAPLVKTTPGFQIPSPQKPLSATASLFTNILDSPDKSKDTPSSTTTALEQPTPSQSSSNVTASPFKFASSTTSTPSKPDATPSFQVPKFGNATGGGAASGVPKFGGGSSNNFLSAFGAQAAKEAEKDKAKRKAEDFDSDEDDEAEWERQDKEKQEAKKRALEQQSKKTLKMVDGQFQWVDTDESSPATQSKAASPPKAPSFVDGAASPSVFSNATSPAPSSLSNPFAQLSRSQSPIGTIERDDFSSQPQSNTYAEETDEDEEDSAAPISSGSGVPSTPAKSGGLFDRIDRNADGTPQRDDTSKASKTPVFSFTKTSPAADNTWKPESPIKFGGAGASNGSTTPVGSPAKNLFSFATKSNDTPSDEPTNSTPAFKFGATTTPKFNFGTSNAVESGDTAKPFGSIFGTPAGGSISPSPSPSIFANLGGAPSSAKGASGAGFSFGGPASSLAPGPVAQSTSTSVFGSQVTSRATTPGATTADESSTVAGTDNEEDAAPAEAQRDLTSLSAEEQRTEDVLFEQKARCRKYVRGADQPWDNKGVGIIRLLKNKETGNARVLMRLEPSGNIVINANVIKDQSMYTTAGEKAIKLVFAEQEGQLSTYSTSFGTKEKATDLLNAIKGVI